MGSEDVCAARDRHGRDAVHHQAGREEVGEPCGNADERCPIGSFLELPEHASPPAERKHGSFDHLAFLGLGGTQRI